MTDTTHPFHTAALDSLRASGLSPSSHLEMLHLLDQIIAYAGEVLNADSVGIMLYDAHAEELIASNGLGIASDQIGVVMALDEGVAGEAFTTGEVVTVEDYDSWEKRRKTDKWTPKTAMGLPLHWEGQKVGVILFGRHVPTPFSDYDAYLGQLFSSQVGIIIGNARLTEAERLSKEQVDALSDITQALSAELNTDNVLNTIMQNANRVLPVDSASVVMLEGGTPTLSGFYNLGPDIVEDYEAYDLHQSPNLIEVLRTGKPLIIDDVTTSDKWVKTPATRSIRSWLGVPLRTGEVVLGVLTLDSTTRGAFQPNHIEIAQALASHTAIALQKASLYEKERETRARMEALLEASQILAQELEFGALFEAIIDSVHPLIDYVAASVAVFEGDRTRFVAFRGYEDLPPDQQEALLNLDLSDSPILKRLREEKQPVTIGDVHAHPGWVEAEGGERIKSFMGIPLIARGEVLGALMLDGSTLDQFGPKDVEVARAFGAQAAIALENARLFDQTRTALQQTEQLYRLGQALLTAPDLHTMLRIFGEPFLEGPEATPNCIVTLAEARREGDAIEVIIAEQVTNDPNHNSAVGQQLTIDAAAYTQLTDVLLVTDIKTLREVVPQAVSLLEAMRVRALAIIPLIVRGRLGGLIAVSWSAPRTFSEADKHHLQVLGVQLSSMFENRLLFRQTQEALAQTEGLYWGSRRVTGAHSVEELLRALHSVPPLQLFEEAFLLTLVRDETNTPQGLQVEAITGSGPVSDLLPVGMIIPEGRSVLDRYYDIDAPHVLRDLAMREAFNDEERAIIQELGLRTAMFVPLRTGGLAVGGICAVSTQEIPLPVTKVRQVQALVSQAAIVLQNLRLLAEMEDALQRSQQVYEASRRMVEAEGLNSMLAAFASHAFELGAARAALYTHTPDQPDVFTLEAVAYRGGITGQLEAGRTFSLDEERYLEEWREQSYELSTVRTAEQLKRMRMAGHALPDDLDREGITVIPLRLNDLTATVSIEWLTPPPQPETALHQYYGTLAPHFAALIANLRLLDQTRRARQRFEDVAMSMSDAVWEIEQGMLTYIAGGLVATLGYDPLQTPLALELKRVVHPDDMPGLRAILKEGKPFTDFKHRLLTQEGGYRWHRTSGTPIRDEAGTLLGYRGVTRNTHEAELTAQRERLASQIGSSLTSVLSLDDLLRRIVAEMHEILGFYHVHVRLYDPDRDVLVLRQEAGQGSSIIRQMLHHIKMEGYPFIEPLAARSLSPVVVNNLREEATHIPNPRLPEARALAALPLFRGQRLLGVLAVHDDTVGRFTSSEVAILQNIAAQASIAVENARLYKALESQAANLELLVRERTAEILKERERIQTIVENTGEGVLLLNEDGLVEYANQAMADIVGLPRKRLVGRVVPLLTYRRLLASPKPLRELVTVFKMNQSWTGRLRFRRPDGSEYDGELKLSAVKNDTGEDTNFVVLLRDVTAQMEVERMRKRFVENVSHELRTPVANIKLYETLLRTGSEAKRDQYLSTLQKQVGRLERLVEDLLDLSRIEQGRVTVQLDMLNLNTLVQETIAIHRLKAEERGLSLNLELAEGLPPLLGDRERLGQVITNLLANAINYTEPGDRIGVRTWLDADTDQVMLALWDTGFGIAPKHQPFIFNRFYRSQHAKDSGRPGTGLGLAIVKEIVTSHGGSITVESKLNVGTTFVVALPTSLIQA